ncbi:glycoside hydrolase family 17 protein [Aspergillus carbonarius ITEM 5010]|uniref:Glycoside hydrolase family 17 protein n=1 Tax=Aspergillus carbonarius (strain ITEM 5010) TaxID=602072 RepID=A0A1R3S150_ASPC5|nr:glycoside hydrolase family 17 protein [Aspergillus carbonarius ITEM 5010]
MKRLMHLLAVVLFSYIVNALPYDNHADKRDLATPSDTEAANVIVWVDQDGDVLASNAADSNQAPTATGSNSPTNLPPLLPVLDDDVPFQLSPALPVSEPSNPPQTGNDRRFGISYSPYNDDGTCKTQDQVNQDLDKLTQYAFVRIYGIDCDQTKKVTTAARQRNLKVFAGVFDLQNFPASLDYITGAAAGDWSVFHTITIGNELVNKGQNSVGDVVNAVNTARKRLRAAGYRGSVVTVDTFSVMLQHPELCVVSDYCAANCHAFFDANNTPDQAGQYVKNQAAQISKAAHNKKTLITESGWPHAGQANGEAIPSPENQQKALTSLKQAFTGSDQLVLFTAFDDQWKQDSSGTYGAEKYWGIEKH